MHDPKFEKEVQQKMEELVFSPSDAVWAKVERAVGKEKKRRVPFFWLFFLPGIVLLGAGGIYFGNKTNKSSSSARKTSSDSSLTINPSASAKFFTPIVTSAPTVPSASSVPSTSPDLSAKSGALPVKSPEVSTTKKRSDKDVKNAAPDHSISDKPSGQPGGGIGVEGIKANGISIQTKTGSQPESRSALITSTGKIVSVNTGGQPGVFPGFRTINKPGNKTIVAVPTIKQNNLTASPTKLSPKRTWEAGFTGGIGISTVNASFLTSPSIQAYDLSNANGLTAVTARAQKPFTSNIRPGPSFWAGIIMQKQISTRFTVSAGLSLHYYSTRIKTGQKVDYYQPLLSSNAFVSSGYAPAAAPQATVYPYYALGDELVYTNRYYFLELPASLQYRLNHSKTMPLFWEGGIALSYLMSSNALYYNQKSDVYNKDGQVSNRAQVNVSTALLLGLPVGSSRLQVGPQIQYGLTSLLEESYATSGGGRHLFYGGIKLVLLPAGKGKK
ncbi:outer membrane beta-barrel protein [Flavitalea flava]